MKANIKYMNVLLKVWKIKMDQSFALLLIMYKIPIAKNTRQRIFNANSVINQLKDPKSKSNLILIGTASINKHKCCQAVIYTYWVQESTIVKQVTAYQGMHKYQ